MSEHLMSAQNIFALAPVGTMISWSNQAPLPPEHETDAHATWLRDNNRGLLVGKTWAPVMGNPLQPAAFKISIAAMPATADSDMPSFRTFAVDCDLGFSVLQRPPIGSCRIFDRAGDDAELLNLASSRHHAETWVRNIGFGPVVIDEVTADDVVADHVEGRAAA